MQRGTGFKQWSGNVFKQFSFEASVRAKVTLDDSFFQGVLDTGDKDTGYVYMAKVGVLGPINRGRAPSRKALALIRCGTMDFYKIESVIQKSFTHLKMSIDLASDDQLGSLALRTLTEKYTCVHVATDGEKVYFCTEEDHDAQELKRAVELQQMRFRDARTRGGDFAKDATWFRKLNPVDLTTLYPGDWPRPKNEDEVTSPAELWTNTVEGLFPDIARCCCEKDDNQKCMKMGGSKLQKNSNPFNRGKLVCPDGYRHHTNAGWKQLPSTCT
jgi:hypothetical protein